MLNIPANCEPESKSKDRCCGKVGGSEERPTLDLLRAALGLGRTRSVAAVAMGTCLPIRVDTGSRISRRITSSKVVIA
jgi:hypothetical protein